MEGHPYQSLYKDPKLNDVNIDCLVPDQRVKVTIEGIKESSTSRMSKLYKIHLQHCGFKWTIIRSYAEIINLQKNVSHCRMLWKMGLSRKQHKNFSHSGHSNIPQMPKILAENNTQCEKLQEKIIKNFLQELVDIDFYRNCSQTWEFLEVSPFSFLKSLGEKMKEGFVMKRSDKYIGMSQKNLFKDCCQEYCGKWNKIWLILKETYLAYVNASSGCLECVMLLDKGFKCQMSNVSEKYRLYVQNYSRKLKLGLRSSKEVEEWEEELKKIISKGSDFTNPNINSSFAPQRVGMKCKYFIDGAEYFECLLSALKSAKEDIFISGWWLVPQIYLKRPGENQYQLQKVLRNKAKQGVNIFIMLYKEVKFALKIDSEYTEKRLSLLHKNIKILCHPQITMAKHLFYSHHEKLVCIDQTYAFLGGIDLCYGRWDTQEHVLQDMEKYKDGKTTRCLWVGKDYYNPIAQDVTSLQKFYADVVDRSSTPRLPWHDIHMYVQGAAARDSARHFIQRWNHAKTLCMKNQDYPLLLPKSYLNDEDVKPIGDIKAESLYEATCQICRSVSRWSAGTEITEASIQEAYVSAIEEAEHFIYIEQQFFITQPSGVNNIYNKIADSIFQRISKAIQQKETFRVIVILPLQTCFEGKFGEESGIETQRIMYYHFLTICRGETSLYARLKNVTNDPSDYISFYSLRNHGVIKEQHVTEMIYIHSKLMIVDDKIAIIASANINDRSLIGSRDSEIGIVIRDTKFIKSKMNNKVYKTGTFCHSLRMKLCQEHLGLIGNDINSGWVDVSDPVIKSFYKDIWQKTAIQNTEIFESVFQCIPSNSIRRFKDIKDSNRSTPISITNPAKKKLRDLKGTLVVFPLEFLSDENLAVPWNSIHMLVPDFAFT